MKKKLSIKAFSLAELMIVMLILTIILAATMPILSKRAKIKAAAAATSTGAGGESLYLYGINSGVLTGYGSCNEGDPYIYQQSGGYTSHTGGICHKFGNSYFSQHPPSCPSTGGWTDAGNIGITPPPYSGGSGMLTRTCYNTNKKCSTLYLYGVDAGTLTGYGSCVEGDPYIYQQSGGYTSRMGGVCHKFGSSYFSQYPPACPSDWTDVGDIGIMPPIYSGASGTLVRACYKCS